MSARVSISTGWKREAVDGSGDFTSVKKLLLMK